MSDHVALLLGTPPRFVFMRIRSCCQLAAMELNCQGALKGSH